MTANARPQFVLYSPSAARLGALQAELAKVGEVVGSADLAQALEAARGHVLLIADAGVEDVFGAHVLQEVARALPPVPRVLLLVQQLMQYKRFKDAAALLEARAERHALRLPRQPPAPGAAGGPQRLQPVELWDLVSAFGRLLSETKALEPQQVVEDETPQAVYQDLVRERLRAGPRVQFRDLFTPPYHRVRLVGLFLAVLELIRRFEAVLEQDGLFGEIWLGRATTPAP